MYGQGIDKPVLNKQLILSRINGLSILKSYVSPDLEPYDGFICPDWVRAAQNRKRDTNSSASVYISTSGEYLFKDWGTGFKGDVFEMVKLKYNCDYNTALQIIANDFGIDYLGNKSTEPARFENNAEIKYRKEYSEIRYSKRKFEYYDKTYWLSYGVPIELLNSLKIYAVDQVWLNGALYYIHRAHDPAYAYDWGDGKVKIYFPKRTKTKFLTNLASHNFLEGFDSLPRFGKELIITKSYKDVAFIRSLDIPSVSTSSESILVNNSLMEEVQSRFAIIYILFDNDDQGISMSNTYIQEYPFLNQIFIPKSISKDITDTSKKKGKEFAEKTLKELMVL